MEKYSFLQADSFVVSGNISTLMHLVHFLGLVSCRIFKWQVYPQQQTHHCSVCFMSRHFGKKISRIVARLRHDGHHLGINLFGFPEKFLPGHPKRAYQCMQQRHSLVSANSCWFVGMNQVGSSLLKSMIKPIKLIHFSCPFFSLLIF